MLLLQHLLRENLIFSWRSVRDFVDSATAHYRFARAIQAKTARSLEPFFRTDVMGAQPTDYLVDAVRASPSFVLQLGPEGPEPEKSPSFFDAKKGSHLSMDSIQLGNDFSESSEEEQGLFRKTRKSNK